MHEFALESLPWMDVLDRPGPVRLSEEANDKIAKWFNEVKPSHPPVEAKYPGYPSEQSIQTTALSFSQLSAVSVTAGGLGEAKDDTSSDQADYFADECETTHRAQTTDESKNGGSLIWTDTARSLPASHHTRSMHEDQEMTDVVEEAEPCKIKSEDSDATNSLSGMDLPMRTLQKDERPYVTRVQTPEAVHVETPDMLFQSNDLPSVGSSAVVSHQ
jgi:hypothetical protein